MKTLFTCLLLVITGPQIFGQSKTYFARVRAADSLYVAEQYLASANMFNSAFALMRGKGQAFDLLKAARSWVKANETDSALKKLERLVYENRYGAHTRLSEEPTFTVLHQDGRWKNLLDTSIAISDAGKARREEMAKYFEPQLAARLDSVYKADQQYRQKLKEVEKQYGRESVEMKRLWREIAYNDSLNLVKVTAILDSRGWLGPDVLHSGSNALFLVIQHADLATQLKYLPMMREAAKNGKLDKGSLAMLEDRVLLRQNQKQIYGTQVRRDSITGAYWVAALEDPDNVDKRREAVGFGPLSDYISHWDLTWDPAQYKKELEEQERKEKLNKFLNQQNR